MTLPESQFPIRCRGLLFDMDGTLIDTTVIVERHWKIWCEGHGVEFEQLIATSHGRPSFEIMKQWAPAHLQKEYQTPEYCRKLEENVANDKDGMLIVPGVTELLKSLPRNVWAVVTSAGLDMAKLRFLQTGLETPPVLISANHVTRGKPHPEGYMAAASQLGLDPKDCVVFEDAPAGVRAGVASGAKAVIGLNTGTMPLEHLIEAGANPIVKSFEELDIKVGEDGWIEINRRQV
ncbi:hypothetical protein BX616_002028 [Lobosporangium transversale]|uniref:HAD-like domain-containing protein n=1 Tax=Lobosporangium transversale TaxID=64571 RepID=A0A1Y2GNF9_9FUNG|nr:HAD-like domain-containing protein [Lobosporangium transversale]KAF9902126.1 hypothetical protein BX616_002028 [Lobosporangium transversale]ORZ12514.1 HAD-like domain-containing protein [Lobosporangium transversale]|eukprot:XP_021880133.1 HAD-like domain-containing protein [Lobosporangium transversale]